MGISWSWSTKLNVHYCNSAISNNILYLLMESLATLSFKLIFRKFPILGGQHLKLTPRKNHCQTARSRGWRWFLRGVKFNCYAFKQALFIYFIILNALILKESWLLLCRNDVNSTFGTNMQYSICPHLLVLQARQHPKICIQCFL